MKLFLSGINQEVPVAENVIEFAVKTSNTTRPNNGISPKFIKDW